MSAIPPRLARRLDRLARRAHRFHRFAHHPLCDAYAGEVLHAGRRLRLCHGCSGAAAGALSGLIAGLAAPVPSTPILVAALAVTAAAAAWAVRPPRSLPRSSKLLTRAVPVALAAGLTVVGLRGAAPTGPMVSVATLCCALLALVGYRRRGPDRSPCRTCPERSSPRTCSGFAPIARREAAFGRLAGRLCRVAELRPRS